MARLLWAARTDVGMIRSGNEDNYAVIATSEQGLFIVADGMGGQAITGVLHRDKYICSYIKQCRYNTARK